MSVTTGEFQDKLMIRKWVRKGGFPPCLPVSVHQGDCGDSGREDALRECPGGSRTGTDVCCGPATRVL